MVGLPNNDKELVVRLSCAVRTARALGANEEEVCALLLDINLVDIPFFVFSGGIMLASPGIITFFLCFFLRFDFVCCPLRVCDEFCPARCLDWGGFVPGR